MRLIIDTGVWSLALRRHRGRKVLSATERAVVMFLRDAIVENRALLLGVVRQEVLSGVRDDTWFETLRQQLHGFDDVPPDVDDYERAAAFANKCRAAGIAASPVDMLVCAVAAGRDLPILTTDQDFERYATLLPVILQR